MSELSNPIDYASYSDEQLAKATELRVNPDGEMSVPVRAVIEASRREATRGTSQIES